MFIAILILLLSVNYSSMYPSQINTPIQANASEKLFEDLLDDDNALKSSRAFIVNKEDEKLEDSDTCSTPTNLHPSKIQNRNHSPILDDDQLLQESFRQQAEKLKESRNKEKNPPNPSQSDLKKMHGAPIPPPFSTQNKALVLQSELLDIDEEEKLSELLDVIDNLDDWNSLSELTPSDFVFNLDITDPKQFQSFLRYSNYIVTRDHSNSINCLLSFKKNPSKKDVLFIQLSCYRQDLNILHFLHNKLEEFARENGYNAITVIPVNSSLTHFYRLRHYQNNGEFGVLEKKL
jgi:hypothetical protein